MPNDRSDSSFTNGHRESVPHRLTPLLPLVAEGYSNHEIAEELSLAPHTVENYVSELMEMCCCRTRIRLAIHIGELHTLQETKESAP